MEPFGILFAFAIERLPCRLSIVVKALQHGAELVKQILTARIQLTIQPFELVIMAAQASLEFRLFIHEKTPAFHVLPLVYAGIFDMSTDYIMGKKGLEQITKNVGLF